jgi:hypothetical protein
MLKTDLEIKKNKKRSIRAGSQELAFFIPVKTIFS